MRMLASLLVAVASVLTPIAGGLAPPVTDAVVSVAHDRHDEQVDPRCFWWRVSDPERYERECR